MDTITTHRKGKRIGVSRNGKGIGLATDMGKGWTATAYTVTVPWDRHIGVFPSADAAAQAIAKVGQVPDYKA